MQFCNWVGVLTGPPGDFEFGHRSKPATLKSNLYRIGCNWDRRFWSIPIFFYILSYSIYGINHCADPSLLHSANNGRFPKTIPPGDFEFGHRSKPATLKSNLYRIGCNWDRRFWSIPIFFYMPSYSIYGINHCADPSLLHSANNGRFPKTIPCVVDSLAMVFLVPGMPK